MRERSGPSYMDNHRQVPWHAEKLTEVYQKLHTSEKRIERCRGCRKAEKKRAQRTAFQTPEDNSSDAESADLRSYGADSDRRGAVFSSAAGMDGRSGDLYNRYRQCGHRYRAGEKSPVFAGSSAEYEFLPRPACCGRERESIVPSGELVTGDIVMLSDGDMVPADLRLIDSANLKVQEASLTGNLCRLKRMPVIFCQKIVLSATEAIWCTLPLS